MASLTRDEAVERAELIQVEAYRIDLDLTDAASADGFGSVTTVVFTCRRPGASTFVELKPAALHEIRLNGAPLDPSSLVDNRVVLADLAERNELVVRATMRYSNTGEGLHRFVDPADGEVYLYAQAFLDEAERIFACFDQPDLKAEMTLTVTAPEGWQVAGNAPGGAVGSRRWEFSPTPPLSTYLVSVVAGPYHVVRDSHDGIPLALYCRQALAPHLDRDAAEIFGYTRVFFDRYHELFGTRYPFGKYDQAFVPEFNQGAMENAGLVVLRDEFVHRTAVADDDLEQRARVIAHEMAHMWFGDLVTMRWWDDLWLNESFAEYLAYRVAAETTRFTSAWTGFAVGRKAWGYAADQRPSTHPVAPASVPDSGLALLNFDGISYAKGAAVLRQLAAWLGDEAFLAGLREHIRAHAYGNASLADLLDTLARVSGRSLDGWAQAWLRRSQVNTLRPIVSTQDGRYRSVEIVQSAPADHPTLRPHRIDLGVYSGGSRRRVVSVDLDPAVDGGRTAVPELSGVDAGDLLLLNDGDLTYAKIRFDDASRAALPAVLPTLTEPVARALIWAAMTDAVRDAEVPMREFVALFAAGLPVETELTVVTDLLRFATVRPVDGRFPERGAIGRYTPAAQLAAAEAVVSGACLAALSRAPAGGGAQLLHAAGFAAATDDVATLRGWLAGAAPPGLAVEGDLRWTVLARLCALGEAGPREIDAELARDPSGAEHAARCRALLPDPAAKAAAWRILMREDTLSNRLTAAAGEGFWHPRQVELTHPYRWSFFDELPAMAKRRTPVMAILTTEVGYPRYIVEPETATLADALVDTGDLTAGVRRIVIDHTDELRRALAGRTLSES